MRFSLCLCLAGSLVGFQLEGNAMPMRGGEEDASRFEASPEPSSFAFPRQEPSSVTPSEPWFLRSASRMARDDSVTFPYLAFDPATADQLLRTLDRWRLMRSRETEENRWKSSTTVDTTDEEEMAVQALLGMRQSPAGRRHAREELGQPQMVLSTIRKAPSNIYIGMNDFNYNDAAYGGKVAPQSVEKEPSGAKLDPAVYSKNTQKRKERPGARWSSVLAKVGYQRGITGCFNELFDYIVTVPPPSTCSYSSPDLRQYHWPPGKEFKHPWILEEAVHRLHAMGKLPPEVLLPSRLVPKLERNVSLADLKVFRRERRRLMRELFEILKCKYGDISQGEAMVALLRDLRRD